jgi:hypothetical protein
MNGNTASGELWCPACHVKQPSTELITQRKCVSCGHLWRQMTEAEFVERHGRTPAEQRAIGARLGRTWFTDECADTLDSIKAMERQTIILTVAASPIPLFVLGGLAVLLLGVRCS